MSTLVVGGYGSVGRVVCRELVGSSAHDGEVRVAGRDRRHAESLATRLSGDATGVSFDVGDRGSFDRTLADVDRVVVCVDQADAAFVEACLDRGIDYVDVTASDEFFRRVETLDGRAESTGATALLSVGLSPGLTNLLAADAAGRPDGWTRSRRSTSASCSDSGRRSDRRRAAGRSSASAARSNRRPPARVVQLGASRIRGRCRSPRSGGGPPTGSTSPISTSSPGRWGCQRWRRGCASTRGSSPGWRRRWRGRVRIPGPSTRSASTDSPGCWRRSRSASPSSRSRWMSRGTSDARARHVSASMTGSEQSLATGLVAARTVEVLTRDELPSGVDRIHEVIDLESIALVLRERGYRPASADDTRGAGETAPTVP